MRLNPIPTLPIPYKNSIILEKPTKNPKATPSIINK